MTQLSGLFWFVTMVVPLIFLQRLLHREIQAVFLILTRDARITMGIFSLIFLPGVFLHELSHFVMAKILRVPTGRFSLLPQPLPDGRLQLGYVETGRADMLRDSLIGAAPLIVGVAAIIFMGYSRLGVGPVGEALARGDLLAALAAAQSMGDRPDFWLWVYLTFTVANSMLPSASDRRAWGPVLLVAAGVTALMFYAGFGPMLVDSLSGVLERAAGALAAGFSLTVGLNLLILPLLLLLEWVVMRLTGLKVNY